MNNCDIIKDLLPLYIDGVCSQSSAEMVEDHIKGGCQDCQKLLNDLKTDSIERGIKTERDGVIARHSKSERNKTLTVSAALSAILCVPIIVCLIVNIAVGHSLSWFFIVLTALLVFASLTVVPLAVNSYRFTSAILSFTLSLELLLLTCSIYSGGSWFLIAGPSVLFGLSVIFSPYILLTLPIRGFFERNRGLLIMLLNTALFWIMMVCIGLFVKSDDYWRVTSQIVLFHTVVVWAVFLIARYLNINKLTRAGLCTLIFGAYFYSINNIINLILGEKLPWPRIVLNGGFEANDGNIKCIVAIICAVVCIVLTVAGVVARARKKSRKK